MNSWFFEEVTYDATLKLRQTYVGGGGGGVLRHSFNVFEANVPKCEEIWFYHKRIMETDGET